MFLEYLIYVLISIIISVVILMTLKYKQLISKVYYTNEQLEDLKMTEKLQSLNNKINN